MISPPLFSGKGLVPLAEMREGEKMEPASDSNLSVPPRGARRASQLYLFALPMGGEKTDESREIIPQVWEGISTREWNDWRWQLRHRITTLEQLKEV
ncbi:MAG TPA: hypothetical protein VLZ03_07810, partial [Thermodesulfobacteriota bacterium]|nr:hypothetical protein [Thermodesulfobacteriota bacterium]